MTDKKGYTGIDCFRLIAAMLVVAVHTSPLASFSETGDFILTRAAARVAVPFFFMTSGFFLISRYSRLAGKLAAFIKKTGMIYAAAILLYLPVNLYSGYFRMGNFLPNVIKDIVFDGTMYHLWYLPASMAGAAIAWYFVRRFHYPKALAAASVLYLIGLFGDSYYGIAERIPLLRECYGLLFQVSDYTRNGIFFAPVFFVLGGFAAEDRRRLSPAKSACGLAVSFALMLAEALTLHNLGVQRHDSMYLFLLPCMYFLFQFLLHFRGKRLAGLSTLALMVYLLHPMMIVAVRFSARLFHLQGLLVDNSLMHFTAVCAASFLSGTVLTVLADRFRPKSPKQDSGTDRAWLEINLHNLEHNAKALKKAMPQECELMAVMKAEAYGHGMYEIAVHLNRAGVNSFAVATIEEGIALRRYGISGEILILGYTDPSRAKELRKYDLMQTLTDYEHAVRLDEQGCRIKAHIKIDTGMHRLGFDAGETEKILRVFGMKHIQVCGIFTHLCAADSLNEEDVRFTKRQIELFYGVLHRVKETRGDLPKIHMQSSYGLLNYPELSCDYVRAGIALYGVLSAPGDKTVLQPDLKPVLSLKSRVVLLREIKKGESVGYARAFTAHRDSRIAMVPIGYADGLPRNLSGGKFYVLINGSPAPVIGRICMDQMAVDVTDISGVQTGAMVTLIGRDKDQEITAPMAAGLSDSISNEILSRMGRRLKVVTTGA